MFNYSLTLSEELPPFMLGHKITSIYFKTYKVDGELAQGLRSLVVLTEDLSLIPGTPMVVYNYP